MQFQHWITHAVSENPDKVAIHFQGQRISYGQLESLINRLVWLLGQQFQIVAGDRVAHLALNSPFFLVLLFACARIGAIVVPLNYRLARSELAFLLQDAQPRIVFGETAFLAGCIEDRVFPENCQVIALDGSINGDAEMNLASLLANAESDTSGSWSKDSESNPAAPLMIVYTSGTTGYPKGAVLDQNSIQCNALHSQYMHSLTSEDHVLTALPFFHVGGINIQTLPALYCGATVTLLSEFNPSEVLAAFTDIRPSHTVLVPTQMRALAAHPQWLHADLSSLRAVTTGSTMVARGVLKTWHRRGVRTLQVYGCTESSPIAIHQSIDDAESPPGSIGRAAKFCNVRIVDENWKAVSTMTRGEVQLKGQNVMRGYWNNPEKTAAALRDGWLATGDVGYVDEAGNYFLADRIKNIIISGGENIYPAEIERVLLTHGDIYDAAVLGLADKQWGEIVAAAIVRRPGSEVDPPSILEFLQGKIGSYKFPRRITLISEMPRNTMGKVDYEVLRVRLASGD